jgi:ApaG protein
MHSDIMPNDPSTVAISTYSQTTKDIKVSVRPIYLDAQSDPDDHHFVWAYHVRIENQSRQTVQLMERYWHITDALGRVQEVRGPGVVGEQPVLRPGQVFEYTSGTPLPTPSGIMSGHYGMKDEGGGAFDIGIPAFSLDMPNEKPSLN